MIAPRFLTAQEHFLGFLHAALFLQGWFSSIALIPACGSPATAGIPTQLYSRLLRRCQLQRCLCCLMRGTTQEGGPASLRNGCLNSSCAVARCKGSRTSIESKKPRRTEETCNITPALETKTPASSPCSVSASCFSWKDK